MRVYHDYSRKLVVSSRVFRETQNFSLEMLPRRFMPRQCAGYQLSVMVGLWTQE